MEEKESWIKALNEGINRGKNKVFDEVRETVFKLLCFCVFSSMAPLAKSRTCLNPCSPHPSCTPAMVQGKRRMVCKVGQVPSLQSLGSEDFWELPFHSPWKWPGQRSSCSAELCRARMQLGETHPPHAAIILSTKQCGNGVNWLGYSPVFRTGKV